MKQNLLSINQLTSNLDYDFKFDPKEFVVPDRGSGRLIFTRRKSQNIYTRDLSKHLGPFSNRHQKTTNFVWHCRLAHYLTEVLRPLKQQKLINVEKELENTRICDSCQMAKSTILPFNKTVFRGVSAFDKTYSNHGGQRLFFLQMVTNIM